MPGQIPMQWTGVTNQEKLLGGSGAVVQCSPPRQRGEGGCQLSADCDSRDGVIATLFLDRDPMTGELTKSWAVPNPWSSTEEGDEFWGATSDTVSLWKLVRNSSDQVAGVDFSFFSGHKIRLRRMTRQGEFPDLTQPGWQSVSYDCTAYIDFLDPNPSAGGLATINPADPAHSFSSSHQPASTLQAAGSDQHPQEGPDNLQLSA